MASASARPCARAATAATTPRLARIADAFCCASTTERTDCQRQTAGKWSAPAPPTPQAPAGRLVPPASPWHRPPPAGPRRGPQSAWPFEQLTAGPDRTKHLGSPQGARSADTGPVGPRADQHPCRRGAGCSFRFLPDDLGWECSDEGVDMTWPRCHVDVARETERGRDVPGVRLVPPLGIAEHVFAPRRGPPSGGGATGKESKDGSCRLDTGESGYDRRAVLSAPVESGRSVPGGALFDGLGELSGGRQDRGAGVGAQLAEALVARVAGGGRAPTLQ